MRGACFLCFLWKYVVDRHGVLRSIQPQQLTAAVTIVAIAATPPSTTVNRRNVRQFFVDFTDFRPTDPLCRSMQIGGNALCRALRAHLPLAVVDHPCASGGWCGRGVLMRVLTTFLVPPQHAQRTTGRGLGSTGLGITLSRSCNSAIVLLLLGCKKPSLRARRNPLGNVCCKTSRKNSTPLTVRVSTFPVFPLR